MKPLPRLLAYFRPYRWRAVAALAAMGIVSLSTVLLLYLLTKVIDDVLGAGAASAIPGFGSGAGERAAPFLRWLDSVYFSARETAAAAGLPARFAVPLLLLLSLAAKNVFSYFSEFAFNGIGLSMVRDLRRDAYAKLLRQSASFYSRSSTGDLLSRLLSDVELIQSAFGTRLADFVQGAVTIVLVLVYIVSLNAQLSVFVLVLAPILAPPDHRGHPAAAADDVLLAGTHRRDGRAPLRDPARASRDQDLRDGAFRGGPLRARQ